MYTEGCLIPQINDVFMSLFLDLVNNPMKFLNYRKSYHLHHDFLSVHY